MRGKALDRLEQDATYRTIAGTCRGIAGCRIAESRGAGPDDAGRGAAPGHSYGPRRVPCGYAARVSRPQSSSTHPFYVLALTVLDVGSWLAVLMALAPPAHAGPRVDATVVAITDGDTLWAELAQPGAGLAAREKVRLVGIDCPEKDQAPWGPQATARLSSLVLGAQVQIEVALQSRDRYGRLLGSIWRDGVTRAGAARARGAVRAVPGAAERRVRRPDPGGGEQARRDGVGIYAPAGPLFESPREYRRRRVGTDRL